MKKVLSVFAILLLAVALIACKKEDSAQKVLDDAYDSLAMIITDPNAITTSFSVPAALAGGVKATWSSSEAGIVSIGEETDGMVLIIVNRPAKGSGNAEVTLTADLSIKSALSDKMLTKKWTVDLTIIESSVEVVINNIADILALKDDKYDPTDKKDKISVTIQNATIFAKGGDTSFAYDGTGIIQIYANTDVEVGKVYTIEGLLEWYYGIWEIIDSTHTLQASATPQYPDKETVESVTAKINALKEDGLHTAAAGSAKDGNMEPIFATVTGKIHVLPGDSSNYNTYLVDTNVNLENWVTGTLGNPADGLLVYYNTNNFTELKSYDGFEVTIDVVIYTYRSNNHAFAIYYVGGKDGIKLGELTDEQKVTLDLAKINLPIEVLETKEKALNLITEGENGSVVSWELKEGSEGLVNLTNGNVTIPATGQEKVVLKATVTSGEATETKEFTVWIGAAPVLTIAEAKEFPNNRTFITSGVLTGNSGHNQLTIEDSTGAIVLYGKNLADYTGENALAFGNLLTVVGKKAVYNDLHQISSYTITKKETGTLPAVVDLDAVDLDAETLLPHQSKLVSLTNMVVTQFATDSYGNVTMTLTRVDGQTINFKWDSRVVVTGQTIDTLKVGDVVNVVNAPLSWNKGALIGFDTKEQIVKVTPTDEVKANFDALDLIDELTFTAVGDLNLPAKGTYFESAITYAFKNTEDPNNAVIDLTTGKVVSIPSNGVTIVLVATLAIGEASVTKDITISVSQGGTVVAAYPSGAGTTNMNSGNNASTIGLDPNLFTVTSTERVINPLHVGLNNAGQIRLYGGADTEGNILTFEIDEAFVITGIKITFGATVAPTLIMAGTTELHNGTLTANQVLEFTELNAALFSIKNINNSTGQLYVMSVEITYTLAPTEE